MWLRDVLEEVYALLFRFLGFGFRLAMSNVGWLATQKCRIPSSARRSSSRRGRCCTASFVSTVNTHLTTFPSHCGHLRTDKSDVYQQPIAGLIPLALCCCGCLCLDVVLCSLLSHALSQVQRQGIVGDEVDGVKVEMCIAKRGWLCGSRKPLKTVAPTADEGWLSNTGRWLVACIRDVLGGRKLQFVVPCTWCLCPFLTVTPSIIRPHREPVVRVGGAQEEEDRAVVVCSSRIQCAMFRLYHILQWAV